MEYDYDEFSALVEEVEHQGGALLPETCEGKKVAYSIKGSTTKTKVNTCRCGNDTILITVYEPTSDAESKTARSRGGGFARACAVCDDIGEWPRYREAIYG